MRVMRLGIPLGSLVKFLRQARSSFGGCSTHDCGDVCLPEQGYLASEERGELAWLRKRLKKVREQNWRNRNFSIPSSRPELPLTSPNPTLFVNILCFSGHASR